MNKKTAYSILELSLVSEGSSFKETLNNSLVLAKVADGNNYTRYWFAEHHNSEAAGSSATSVLVGYVAENTSKIRVGSGGIMLPNHSPLVIAEQFGTLAQLYSNRTNMGMGRAPGTDMPTALAIRSDFVQAARSFATEIQKIEQYFSAHNHTAQVRVPIAEGTELPIYILGSSTDSAHLAAKKGLPYAFASHFASTHLYSALKIYREEFQPSEVLEQPYTIAGVNIIVADTEEEAESLFTSLIRMFFGDLTGNPRSLQPPTKMTDHLINDLNHPSLHQMLKYSFVGNKATVKQQVEDFINKTRIDELMMVSNIFALEDRVKSARLFAEIIDEINKKSLPDFKGNKI